MNKPVTETGRFLDWGDAIPSRKVVEQWFKNWVWSRRWSRLLPLFLRLSRSFQVENTSHKWTGIFNTTSESLNSSTVVVSNKLNADNSFQLVIGSSIWVLSGFCGVFRKKSELRLQHRVDSCKLVLLLRSGSLIVPNYKLYLELSKSADTAESGVDQTG